MLDHCSACRGTDVTHAADRFTCLSCGASTPYVPEEKPAKKKG